MKRTLLLILLYCLPLAAAEKTIDLDPARTTVAFTLSDVLHTVHGTFKMKRGTLRFDPVTGDASGEIVVDVTSGDSGSHGRDKRMHQEILESARYPEAVFTADRVTGDLGETGESQLEVHGVFQIHGAGHPVTFQFRAQSNSPGKGEVTASTSLTIPYVQWGMKNPSNFLLKVSDKVELSIQAVGRIR